MKDTPETDSLVHLINSDPNIIRYEYDFVEMTDHARKLERERDKYKTAILECLEKNCHLADGDQCTLIGLKRALL